MAILSVLALLIFGEQKLPGIMRQAGRVMREVQNTSQSFIREMERAADVEEPSVEYESRNEGDELYSPASPSSEPKA